MIAGVVVAAGASRRLGRPKQLLPLGGRPLLAWVLETVRSAGFDQVVLVLGHEAVAIRQAVDFAGIDLVINDRHGEGMSTSLQAGLGVLRAEITAAVVLVGDQPFIDGAHIGALRAAWLETGQPIIATDFGEYLGPPMFLARHVWPLVAEIRGDQGARKLLRDHPAWVSSVRAASEAASLDVDTDEAYEQARQWLENR